VLPLCCGSTAAVRSSTANERKNCCGHDASNCSNVHSHSLCKLGVRGRVQEVQHVPACEIHVGQGASVTRVAPAHTTDWKPRTAAQSSDCSTPPKQLHATISKSILRTKTCACKLAASPKRYSGAANGNGEEAGPPAMLISVVMACGLTVLAKGSPPLCHHTVTCLRDQPGNDSDSSDWHGLRRANSDMLVTQDGASSPTLLGHLVAGSLGPCRDRTAGPSESVIGRVSQPAAGPCRL